MSTGARPAARRPPFARVPDADEEDLGDLYLLRDFPVTSRVREHSREFSSLDCVGFRERERERKRETRNTPSTRVRLKEKSLCFRKSFPKYIFKQYIFRYRLDEAKGTIDYDQLEANARLYRTFTRVLVTEAS